jgi:hypothetical protein
MPRAKDLTKSVVYHIRFIDTKEVVYVGSTCNFIQRRRDHKCRCLNEINGKTQPIHIFMREQGGFDLFEIIPISYHSLTNEVELVILEQQEIDKYPDALNKKSAYVSIEKLRERNRKLIKDWCEANKEYIKEKSKAYYETNKEQISEKSKAYRETHKEQINEKKKAYYETNKEQISEQKKAYKEAHKEQISEKDKAYRETHKEQIRERNKAYREANKERIAENKKEYQEAHKEQLKEKIECPCCNKLLTRGSVNRHKKALRNAVPNL